MKKLLLLFISAMVVAGSANAETKEISIRNANGRIVSFDVEIAKSERDHERGLMFRKSIPASHGMLFAYHEPAYRAFWMKNTLIPLDILFFNTDGELVYIAPSARPESLDALGPEREDICAVLEINGGEATLQDLKTGDRLVLADSSPSACLP